MEMKERSPLERVIKVLYHSSWEGGRDFHLAHCKETFEEISWRGRMWCLGFKHVGD